MPAFFDASRMTVQQLEAKSRDGTSVPYFVVGSGPALKNAPTMLYGYGGFEIALEPFYSGTLGRAWLARGGVLVRGEHSWRRRVRAGVASGGVEGKAPERLRRLHCDCRGSRAAQVSRSPSRSVSVAAAMAVCWWARR